MSENKEETNGVGWDIKVVERKRGRMKFQIKLSKEETESFKNFKDYAKPDGISDDDFHKTLFFKGIQSINEDLRQLAIEYAKEKAEEMEKKASAEQSEIPVINIPEANDD